MRVKVISLHCSAPVIQKSGSFETVLECLKADFYSGAIQNNECAQQVRSHLTFDEERDRPGNR